MSGFFQTMFNTDTEGNFPKLFLQTRRAITGCAWNQIKALRGGNAGRRDKQNEKHFYEYRSRKRRKKMYNVSIKIQ